MAKRRKDTSKSPNEQETGASPPVSSPDTSSLSTPTPPERVPEPNPNVDSNEKDDSMSTDGAEDTSSDQLNPREGQSQPRPSTMSFNFGTITTPTIPESNPNTKRPFIDKSGLEASIHAPKRMRTTTSYDIPTLTFHMRRVVEIVEALGHENVKQHANTDAIMETVECLQSVMPVNHGGPGIVSRLGEMIAKLESAVVAITRSPTSTSIPTPTPTTQTPQVTPSYANAAKKTTPPTHPNPKKSTTNNTPPARPQPPSIIAQHDRRLVITLTKNKNIKIPTSGIDVHNINLALERTPCQARVLVIQVSKAGNPVIVVRESDRAEALLPYVNIIVRSLFKDDDYHAYPASVDTPRFSIKINFVPRSDFNGESIDADAVWKCIQGNDSSLKQLNTVGKSTWLQSNREDHAGGRRGTVVVSFRTEEEAKSVLMKRRSVAYGEQVTFTKYEQRPNVHQCTGCGSFSHPTPNCRKRKCLKCASTEHSTQDHPAGSTVKCGNCGKQHETTYRDCPERLRRLGIRLKGTSKAGAQTKESDPPAPSTTTSQPANSQSGSSAMEEDDIL